MLSVMMLFKKVEERNYSNYFTPQSDVFPVYFFKKNPKHMLTGLQSKTFNLKKSQEKKVKLK